MIATNFLSTCFGKSEDLPPLGPLIVDPHSKKGGQNGDTSSMVRGPCEDLNRALAID